MMSDETKNEQATKAAGWLTGLLTGWGVPGSVARILAGAIIGAAIAIMAMAETSCTTTYSQTTAEGGSTEISNTINPLPDDIIRDVIGAVNGEK